MGGRQNSDRLQKSTEWLAGSRPKKSTVRKSHFAKVGRHSIFMEIILARASIIATLGAVSIPEEFLFHPDLVDPVFDATIDRNLVGSFPVTSGCVTVKRLLWQRDCKRSAIRMPVATSMVSRQSLPTEQPRTEVQRGTYLQESPVPRAIPLYLGAPLEKYRSIVSKDMA